jgi:hypothetical protein
MGARAETLKSWTDGPDDGKCSTISVLKTKPPEVIARALENARKASQKGAAVIGEPEEAVK